MRRKKKEATKEITLAQEQVRDFEVIAEAICMTNE
jgi:hypothetical protein